MNVFFVKLILVLTVSNLLIFFINKILRKWLNVEKRKTFSYGHVNAQHKKFDWTIRIAFIVFLLTNYIVYMTRMPEESIWSLETYVILFTFLIVSEITRAIFEKKYAENKKDYVFTIIQLVLIIALLLSLFLTDFFGLFG